MVQGYQETQGKLHKDGNRIPHGALRGHLKKLGIEENGMRVFCDEEEETPIHLLADCQAMFRKSKECFNIYLITDIELNKVKTYKHSFINEDKFEKGLN